MKDDSCSSAREEASRSVRNLLSSSIGVALVAGAVPAAQAATLTVTNNADTGSGSLRDTVANANPGDTVVFQPGLTSPITLTSGQIVIDKALTISGPGAGALTIDGNNASRIFYVKPASVVDVTISGLTLSDGNVAGDGGAIRSLGANFTLQDSVVENSTAAGSSGGGVYAGKGGATDVAVALSNVTLSNNTARDGGGARLQPGLGGTGIVDHSIVSGNTAATGWGGGLYLRSGATSVIASKVINNHAPGDSAGGIEAYETDFTLQDSEISGNTTSSNGGGLYVSVSTFHMTRSVVSGNTANGSGGGIALNYNLYNGNSGVSIQDSTFTGNVAASRGGGVGALYDANVNIALTNVTIYGNTASANGGGVFSETGYLYLSGTGPSFGSGVLTIESSTIAGNSADTGGGAFASPLGNPVVLHNTIVANNTATTADPDTDGTFTANFNLIFAPGSATLIGGNNILAVDPQLGALGVYGGPTQTMLPNVGSPVINAGDNTGAPSTDQRGLPRPSGGTVDIGADERQNPEDVIFRDGFGP